MKKQFLTFLAYAALSATTIFFSCTGSSSETIDVSTIHVSESKGENIKVGSDLNSFNFRALVNEKLSGVDSKVLEGISWQTSNPSEETELTFQLVLKDAALTHKDSILQIVKTFVDKTLAEYHKTAPTMDEVEVAAEYYMHLIESSTIDTIWLKTSPTLAKFASKNDFNESLKQRKILFKPMGARKIENRRVSGDLGPDIKGSFYTVIFVYENKDHEEVTMEKIGNDYKLLGYRFYVKK